MSLWQSLRLLMAGRAAIVPTDPVTVGDEKVLSIEAIFNHDTRRMRYITSMSQQVAEDVYHDLDTLPIKRPYTHAFTSNLGHVLGVQRGELQ